MFRHLVQLRYELLEGDLRLVYFPWLKRMAFREIVAKLPLINFDFVRLTEAQCWFVEMFAIAQEHIRALALLLDEIPAHSYNKPLNDTESLIAQLSAKDNKLLLQQLFESGFVTRTFAMSLIRKSQNTEYRDFQYWLSPEILQPCIERAKHLLALEQAQAEAERVERERIIREKRYEQVYTTRDNVWRLIDKQAKVASGRSYDYALQLMQELAEAYQFKEDTLEIIGLPRPNKSGNI